ncbi:MAG: sterol desaturase family protein [Pyrinomonadaceae bacterium]|nr:sterol desaturase family protein [Pyrinomonadaceae bacterium]
MKWLNGILTIGAFAVLYACERRRPLRSQIESPEIQTARNLAIASAAGIVMNFLEKPIAGRLTRLVEQRRFGIIKIFRLPKRLETILAIVLLDYTLYLWHVLTHKSKFLWRFHQIHHADLDLTVSTAIRFHFGEITLSVLFRAGQILLIGVSPAAFKIWQTALFLSVFFHHSNVKLPEAFEKKLQKFITTPRLHGIHHSDVESERDSNWSSGLSVWDRLHGTFRDDVRLSEITIGLKEFENLEDVGIGKMLTAPFNRQRVLPPIGAAAHSTN